MTPRYFRPYTAQPGTTANAALLSGLLLLSLRLSTGRRRP
jgi:hypothetical protein